MNYFYMNPHKQNYQKGISSSAPDLCCPVGLSLGSSRSQWGHWKRLGFSCSFSRLSPNLPLAWFKQGFKSALLSLQMSNNSPSGCLFLPLRGYRQDLQKFGQVYCCCCCVQTSSLFSLCWVEPGSICISQAMEQIQHPWGIPAFPSLSKGRGFCFPFLCTCG